MTVLRSDFLLGDLRKVLRLVETSQTRPGSSKKSDSDRVMRLLNKDLRLQDVTLIYVILLAALVVLLVAPYHASSPSLSFQAPDGPSGSFLPYRMPLDPAGQMELFWNISYTKQEVYMQLRVKELRHGVLLGMSDRGEPTNADLMLLWNDGHKSYFGVRASVWVEEIRRWLGFRKNGKLVFS